MSQITLKCRKCGNKRIVKNGLDLKGVQKYRCNACGFQFRANPKSRSHPPALVKQVLQAHQNQMSYRTIYWKFGVAPKTVIAWIRKNSG